MRRVILAALLAAGVMLGGVGFTAQSANAAPAAPAKVAVQQTPKVVWPALSAADSFAAIAATETYSYTEILNAQFPGFPYDYVPVRLIIAHAGTWKHVYRVQFGNIIAPNSEQIQWVWVRQAHDDGTWMGNGYSQAYVNVLGGATQALGATFTPWIPSYDNGHADVQIKNIHAQTISKWFPSDGWGSGSGGAW